MPKAFLNLKNEELKKFIINSSIYEISDDANNSDILFCDSIGEYQKDKSMHFINNKVYLASSKLESFNDLSSFENFDYFLGFGSEFYRLLFDELNFEVSKTFDGFIFDKEYEDSFEDKSLDILVIGNYVSTSSNSAKIKFETRYLCDMLSKIYLCQMVSGKKFSIGINVPKVDSFEEFKNIITESQGYLKHDLNNLLLIIDDLYDIYQGIEVVGDSGSFPMKYVNSSSYLHFLDISCFLLFCDSSLITKSITTTYMNSIIYSNTKNLYDPQEYWPSSEMRSYKIAKKHKITNVGYKDLYGEVFSKIIGKMEPYINRVGTPSRSSLGFSNLFEIKSLLSENIPNILCKNINEEFLRCLNKIKSTI